MGLTAVIAGLLATALPAMAQEEIRSQVNLQLTGIVPKDSSGIDSSGNPITDHGTRSGGFLVGYTFSLNKWAAVEGNYGYTRDTQSYSGIFGTSAVQAKLHEMTGAFLFTMPVHIARVRPYALAGTGALRFVPTSDAMIMVPGTQSQTKAVFLYGGGANFDLTRHIGIRAEYRGLLTKIPDFGLTTLTMGTKTHFAQPSVGIYFRF